MHLSKAWPYCQKMPNAAPQNQDDNKMDKLLLSNDDGHRKSFTPMDKVTSFLTYALSKLRRSKLIVLLIQHRMQASQQHCSDTNSYFVDQASN
jgi:hypothetical protein